MKLKTLDNALEVLNYFTLQSPDWGLRDLAREMDMNHTVLNRILKTYEEHGFLIQNENTKKYRLGFKFLELSGVIKQKMKLSELVQPVMKELATTVKETVFLTLKDEDDGLTVEIAEYEQQLKFNVTIGTRTPLYVGASCKTIMAHLQKQEQLDLMDKELKVYTDKTITDQEVLFDELNDIKEKGWCYTEGEFSEEVFGIGTPLFNSTGSVIGSLTIAGPSYRMPEEKIEPALEVLSAKTKVIQHYFNEFGNSYLG